MLTVNPSALAFGNVVIGSSSTQGAILTNSGNSTVTLSSVSLASTSFNISGLSAGMLLNPGQAVTFVVTFGPSVSGTLQGSIIISSNAQNSSLSISLSGAGIQPSANIQPTTQLTPPLQAAGYNLNFSDEFDSLNVSPNGLGSSYKWYQGLWWQSVFAPLTDFFVNSSILELDWKNGQGTSTSNLCTAAKDASHYQAWRYGYFEARIAWANKTVGAWPAFWLIPVEDITGADVINGVRDSGEIDVMEGQGGSNPNTVYGTIHEWKNNADIYNNNSSNAYNVPTGVDLSQYHTYGVLWTPGTVSWYFDNQLVHSANTTAIFDQQTFYLVLSSQEGVNWSGGNLSGVTASMIPLKVDWVHVWQKP